MSAERGAILPPGFIFLLDELVLSWQNHGPDIGAPGAALRHRRIAARANVETAIHKLHQAAEANKASAPANAHAIASSCAYAMTAPELLNQAACLMVERGKQYDKPQGERSMAATVAAFNAVTGLALSESHGWLLQAILKMVRDNQRQQPHRDSCEDLIAYTSLYSESRLRG